MRSKKLLLELLKEKYTDCVNEFKELGSPLTGICGTLFLMRYSERSIINRKEKNYLKSLVIEQAGRQETFYNLAGEKISDKSTFLWKITDTDARIQWLDKQILLHTYSPMLLIQRLIGRLKRLK